MNLGRLSINQPILAMVLSIVLLIVGAIAYTTLPVAEYPQVVPPTVVVTAQYPGASAQTISDTVAAPIEQQINGVEDMLYLYSQATSNGQLTITVTFKLGTDLDKAQVLVQNRWRSAGGDPRPEPADHRRPTREPSDRRPGIPAEPHLHRPPEGYSAVRGHRGQGGWRRPHRTAARRGADRTGRVGLFDQQLS